MKSTATYTLRYEEGYEWLLPVNSEDFERLRFDGQPQRDKWQPLEMQRLVIDERSRALARCDFPACSGGDMLILNRAARNNIGSELEKDGELLPLRCQDEMYWAYNVTRLVDALDEDRSQVLRASDTGVILVIFKHEFRHELLPKSGAFKLAQVPRGSIYVTEPLALMIRKSGLKGLTFTKVWELP